MGQNSVAHYTCLNRVRAMAIAQALHNGLACTSYLYTNFQPKPAPMAGMPYPADTLHLIGGMSRRATRILAAGHSGSLAQASTPKPLMVQVYFNGIMPNELPCYALLCDLLEQQDGLFQQHMVKSGLTLGAGLDYAPLMAPYYVRFTFTPNPMGLKEAIEGFFNELRAVALLSYHTPAQLQLAKERAIAKRHMYLDRFATGAALDITDQYFLETTGSASYLDSLLAVNKLDMLRFTRRLLSNQHFLVCVQAPKEHLGQAQAIVWPTKPLQAYQVSWSDHKDVVLNTKAQAVLDTVGYILNLSPWLHAEFVLAGEASRKVKRRRQRQVTEYLAGIKVRNVLITKYVGNNKNGETLEIKPVSNER
ncbi:MAG: hypothetical protein HYZ16_10035 [Bacteroidetes bacterium]|nr:hypothetical protein [Bacteroidota bacterium]